MWLALHIGLVIVFTVLGVAALPIGRGLKLEPPIIGALTGALIAAAATMLGGLLARAAASGDKATRRAAIRTLITAELVNVSAGYVGLHRTLMAAQPRRDRVEDPLMAQDFSNEMPRHMPFTSGLGTELLVLPPADLEVLSTLISNMAITRGELRDFSTGNRSLNSMTVRSLSRAIADDLDILGQAFERISPSRKLLFDGRQPELASVLLRRLGNQLRQSSES